MRRGDSIRQMAHPQVILEEVIQVAERNVKSSMKVTQRPMARIFSVAVAAAVAVTSPALAHRPAFSAGHTGPESAYVIEDVTHSMVLYQEVGCPASQLWLRFDRPSADVPLFVQLGVPVIPRLANYRPVMAVLAPGLPAAPAGLPFAVPDGLGALVLEANATPTEFNEPFTGTRSWVLREETLSLALPGTGYVVAWHPQETPGKLWVAVGTKERFSMLDLLRFPGWRSEARRFHETDGAPSAACTTR